MTKRVENAINVFLDSIQNGTLAKGTCAACAVGNLVADGLDAKIERKDYDDMIDFHCNKKNTYWAKLFMSDGVLQKINKKNINDVDVISNIKATNFTWKELAKIEKAFENNTKIDHMEYNNCSPEEIRKDQLNGLNAVVKVMMEFDEIKDVSVEEIFTSKAELIPC